MSKKESLVKKSISLCRKGDVKLALLKLFALGTSCQWMANDIQLVLSDKIYRRLIIHTLK
jgi:hypothetical protein